MSGDNSWDAFVALVWAVSGDVILCINSEVFGHGTKNFLNTLCVAVVATRAFKHDQAIIASDVCIMPITNSKRNCKKQGNPPHQAGANSKEKVIPSN